MSLHRVEQFGDIFSGFVGSLGLVGSDCSHSRNNGSINSAAIVESNVDNFLNDIYSSRFEGLGEVGGRHYFWLLI